MQYLKTKADTEIQQECASVYDNYDELSDGLALFVGDKVYDISLSVSEEHHVYRIDVYQYTDDYSYYIDMLHQINDKNQIDFSKAELVEQFYLAERTELDELVSELMVQRLS